MKTPDEIKNGLRTCTNRKISCDGCPYHYQGCAARLAYDAIAYINQLENHFGDVNKMIAPVENEAARRMTKVEGLSCICGSAHVYKSIVNVKGLEVNQLHCPECGIIMRSPGTDENGKWLEGHWRSVHMRKDVERQVARCGPFAGNGGVENAWHKRN